MGGLTQPKVFVVELMLDEPLPTLSVQAKELVWCRLFDLAVRCPRAPLRSILSPDEASKRGARIHERKLPCHELFQETLTQNASSATAQALRASSSRLQEFSQTLTSCGFASLKDLVDWSTPC